MSEKKVKHVYRLCPCDRGDVEGIQSWLEDMAMEGLFLADDGVFCGVFTFERGLPKRVIYRLDVAQKRKPRFLMTATICRMKSWKSTVLWDGSICFNTGISVYIARRIRMPSN